MGVKVTVFKWLRVFGQALHREEYYWSLWPYITDECFIALDNRNNRAPARSAYCISKLFRNVIDYSLEVEFPDPNQTRPKFLALLAEKNGRDVRRPLSKAATALG